MGKFKVIAAGNTSVGMRRSQNEDAYFSDAEMGLHFVADGMGGHAAGEVASRTAVEVISEFVSNFQGDDDITWPFGVEEHRTRAENLLISAIKLANKKICEMARENPENKGMGTTIAAVYIDWDVAVIAHVGDSRVYRFRGADLDCLTTDHTWVNEQLQRNIITEEEARNHRWKNVITRALGNRDEIAVDIQQLQLQDGDLLLICSDGLTTMLDDEQVRKEIAEASGMKEGLEKMAEKLIQSANDKGGFDNVSVILLECNNPNDTPTLELQEELEKDSPETQKNFDDTR